MTGEEEPWFGVGPRDVRVQVGTTCYALKVVRRGGQLLDHPNGSGLMLAVVLLAGGAGRLDDRISGGAVGRSLDRLGRSAPGRKLAGAAARIQGARGWKIGVVRQGGDRWGANGPTEVVHVETLPPGPFPEARVAELAEAARAGRFAESRRRWGRNPTSD